MKFINLYNLKIFIKKLYKIFIVMLALFIVSAFLAQLFLNYHTHYITNSKELSFDVKNTETPLKDFLIILLNNLKVSVVAVIIGLIPVLYLPALVPIYNGFITGVLIAILEINSKNVLLFILLGIIPHGVFEMFALLYASSMGIYITKNVSIFRKNNNKKNISLKVNIPKTQNIDYNNMSINIYSSESNPHKYDYNVYLKDIIPEIIQSYVLIIIPLLVAAALIETFITPELLRLIK
ncbi:stage II sporulation protein M [Clostridium sp. WILCCON 0269]|uniref:Stage II sporulation protein M n=1 Tax=Candidatus Clostridium eludens TaxID=3381663 RepID=A0ABW8SNK4_9CLOT